MSHKSVMKFCEECDFLLQPVENIQEQKIYLKCSNPTCNVEDILSTSTIDGIKQSIVEANCVYSNQLNLVNANMEKEIDDIEKEGDQQRESFAHDPTLQRTTLECAKCGKNTECVIESMEFSETAHRMITTYICTNCYHQFRIDPKKKE
mmetsp:Transcript_8609/g.12700  ORF Transcript_8609/g.12700 Transcript_8609/m.12700 type:complete len:149 (+) Transcript_8609:106-552(+)